MNVVEGVHCMMTTDGDQRLLSPIVNDGPMVALQNFIHH